MAIVDIRPLKNELRKKFKRIRSEMPPEIKERKDLLIFDKVANHSTFIGADTLLCFVSTEIEVDTLRLISFALRQKKIVAVPRCHENGIGMDFYIIQSLDDLKPGKFSVLEPDPTICKKIDLRTCKSPLCIVPGLGFDFLGYRLGYGKGYYDRFLSTYKGITAGICYYSCVTKKLPHGRYDRTVDYLFTDRFVEQIDQ